MANIKELRGRINSVGNIAKITKAMEMVASMKLRKIQNRALAIRPYAEELRGFLGHLAESVSEGEELALFEKRPIKTTGIFLVTSDRGLCGAYNTNVLAQVHALEEELKQSDPNRKLKFYVYGKKGYTYLGRRGYDVRHYYADPTLESLDFTAARIVGKDLVDDFLAGEVDDVRIAFTSFTSVARFTPSLDAFLPVSDDLVSDAIAARDSQERKGNYDYLLEPDPESLLELIVKRYLETIVFDAMLESLASEMASRRMAMKGATDAATRMGKELRMVYNRARQESITKELLDIVGGANAVS